MRPTMEQINTFLDDLEKLYFLYTICDRTENLETNKKRHSTIKYGDGVLTIWDLMRHQEPSKPKKGLRKIKGHTITDEEYNETKEERMALIVEALYEWIEDESFTGTYEVKQND